MPLNIIVCAKQVMDPETPASAFSVDREAKRVVATHGIPPVVNGYDEQAVEAALRIKDSQGANITVVAMGNEFVLDVIKKPLSMGCDELVLLQDPAFVSQPDAFFIASVLSIAIKKIGDFDLVLCGRQASDWDMSQVPIGIAELLGLPMVHIVKKVEVQDGKVMVERLLPDGHEVVEAPLPALVSVSNELGEARYPNLRNIMAASRKQPTVWTSVDLGLDASGLTPKLELTDLFVPVQEKKLELVEGEDEADAGKNLALKLREANLI